MKHIGTSVLLALLLVGAAVAKPSAIDNEKVLKLLKKVLAARQEGTGAYGEDDWFDNELEGPEGETTLFQEIPGFPPFKLFNSADEFLTPLNAADVVSKEEIIAGIQAIMGVFGGALDLIGANADPENPPSEEEAFTFLFEELLPYIFNSVEADPEPLMDRVYFSLLQGALAGTVGADVDEQGCASLETEDERSTCIVNKIFLVLVASNFHFGQARDLLSIPREDGGENVKDCYAGINYLAEEFFEEDEADDEDDEEDAEEGERDVEVADLKKLIRLLKKESGKFNKKRQTEAKEAKEAKEANVAKIGGSKEDRPDEPVGVAVLRVIQRTFGCTFRNIGVMVNRIDSIAPPVLAEEFPASDLPLPKLIRFNSILQLVAEQVWFALEDVFVTLGSLAEKRGIEFDRKALKLKRNKYISHVSRRGF